MMTTKSFLSQLRKMTGKASLVNGKMMVMPWVITLIYQTFLTRGDSTKDGGIHRNVETLVNQYIRMKMH